jgi:RNA polymerase sigma factor (TIGR02999 family)
MRLDQPSDPTSILNAAASGDEAAATALLPLVYEELRSLAAGHFKRQPSDHTLQATALVHEAFIRLIRQDGAPWRDRTHFFAVAATAMRQILTDHARRKGAEKRGGQWERVVLDQVDAGVPDADVDVVALDDALTQLKQLDERKHRVVELRFFGGLSVDETATVLSVSKSTVESEWRGARAWLGAQLARIRQD